MMLFTRKMRMTRMSASGWCGRTSFDYSHIVYIKRSSSSYASFWWTINDVVHTENTEGNGGPQADDGGEQELINDGRLFTHYKFSAVFIKLRKLLIADYWLLIVFTRMTRMDTEVRRRNLWGNRFRLMMIDYSHIIYFQRCSSSYASSWLLVLILADEHVFYLDYCKI